MSPLACAPDALIGSLGRRPNVAVHCRGLFAVPATSGTSLQFALVCSAHSCSGSNYPSGHLPPLVLRSMPLPTKSVHLKLPHINPKSTLLLCKPGFCLLYYHIWSPGCRLSLRSLKCTELNQLLWWVGIILLFSLHRHLMIFWNLWSLESSDHHLTDP